MRASVTSFVLASVSVVAFVHASCASAKWVRPDLVARVESGHLKEAKVSWWGYDPVDSTVYLRAALGSKAKKVTLDRQPGPWYTLPLTGRSDLTLEIPEGAVLCAKRGEFRKRGDCLLRFASATNVVITGGGTLKMWFEDYTNRTLYAWSEWRMGLSLLSCRNVLVENLRIADSGGDGIYLGKRGNAFAWANEDVTIRNVVLTRHNRQGISVISADRLLIENCVIADTCGTPPMAGIDFEPNASTEMLRDITVRNCVLRGNHGAGLDFSVSYLTSASPAISITVENCVSVGNHKPLKIHGSANVINGFRGAVVFRNCVFDDLVPGYEQFRRSSRETMSVKFKDCMAANPEKGGRLELLGDDCGWNSIPTPRWPDGSKITAPRSPMPAVSSVRIHDSAPGQMSRFRSVFARASSEYMFYADSPRNVRFLATLRPVGRTAAVQACDIRIVSADGREIARPKAPERFNRECGISFRVPAKGFYRMLVRMKPAQVLNLVGADVPVALVISSNGMTPGLNGRPGEVFIRVPEREKRFAVFSAGGGGAENVRVRIEDPKGVCTWDKDNISNSELWFPPTNPVPGVWKISFLKGSKGCMDDYSVGLFGLPCWLFLSPDKTWD